MDVNSFRVIGFNNPLDIGFDETNPYEGTCPVSDEMFILFCMKEGRPELLKYHPTDELRLAYAIKFEDYNHLLKDPSERNRYIGYKILGMREEALEDKSDYIRAWAHLHYKKVEDLLEDKSLHQLAYSYMGYPVISRVTDNEKAYHTIVLQCVTRNNLSIDYFLKNFKAKYNVEASRQALLNSINFSEELKETFKEMAEDVTTQVVVSNLPTNSLQDDILNRYYDNLVNTFPLLALEHPGFANHPYVQELKRLRKPCVIEDLFGYESSGFYYHDRALPTLTPGYQKVIGEFPPDKYDYPEFYGKSERRFSPFDNVPMRLWYDLNCKKVGRKQMLNDWYIADAKRFKREFLLEAYRTDKEVTTALLKNTFKSKKDFEMARAYVGPIEEVVQVVDHKSAGIAWVAKERLKRGY